MMRVLIVDDEAPARRRLERLVSDFEGWSVAGKAEDGASALDRCQTMQPDVVLLDIRMPRMSGLEVARHLARLEEPPAVIFTTAYDEYAVRAFEAQAVDYLVKPVRRARLAVALERATRPTRAQLQSLVEEDPEARRRLNIAARLGDRLQLVPVEDVRLFRADQKYVVVHHEHGEVLIDESLKALEEEFDPPFYRVHRNALVNLEYLDCLERDVDGRPVVRLRGLAEPVLVSRRHLSGLRRRISGA